MNRAWIALPLLALAVLSFSGVWTPASHRVLASESPTPSSDGSSSDQVGYYDPLSDSVRWDATTAEIAVWWGSGDRAPGSARVSAGDLLAVETSAAERVDSVAAGSGDSRGSDHEVWLAHPQDSEWLRQVTFPSR